MKWRNHVDIASSVARELSLPPELRGVLKAGVLQPDREGDKVVRLDRNALPYRQRIRHHHPRRRFIMGLLWKARAAHLEGREEDAVWCLGRALHYVQDGSVAVGPFHIFHDRREEELGRRKAAPRAIHLGGEYALPSPMFVSMCLRSLTPKRRTRDSMFQACLLSSALSSAVLSPPWPSEALVAETRRAERRHRLVFLPLAVGAAITAATGLLLLGQPLLLPLAALLAAGIHRSDLAYHHYLRERRWFVHAAPASRTI
ncbi:MAG: hypothetical protein MUE65_05025 [Methanomassiliicoccales archaeon]|nr:hypothetical protein [Methanomassiliicoccales archaeon]